MRIFIPNTLRDEFVYFLMDRVYEEANMNIEYTERSSNGVFACLEWEQEEITYEMVKKLWKDFTDKKDNGSIVERKEYQLEDGSIVICPTGNLLSIFQGSNTDRYNTEEPLWRIAVEELVNSLSFDAPFVVEFNPTAYSMKRNVPTITLIGREVWRNNGERDTRFELCPVVFRNTANLVAIPSSVAEPSRLTFCYNEPEKCIITPYCIVIKNYKGFGNTVFLRSISFSDSVLPGAKNIYEALKEEIFWTRILIPLATTDFEVLRSELEQQETPLAIQLRLFKIQSQEALQQEIEGLKASKRESEQKITSYIRAITDQKLGVHKLEEVIREKTIIFEKGLVAKSLEDEFKRIMSLHYVEEVKFIDTNMVITTKPIQIDDGPFLGGYDITYNVQSKNLNIHNNVNPKGDYGLAHPHIYQDGDICFGNYSDIFFRFEIGEYYVGLELLHEFLSTYNPEDEWGHRLIRWDAKYVFEDMRERGILNELEAEWDDIYYNLYYEHLPCVNVCEDCGEPLEDCECNRCQYCERPMDDCECWLCPECGCEVGNDCRCDRCESCNELVGDCECERCDYCEELLDPHNRYSNHCECERCPDDYDIFVDTDELGCCTECETWDCEHNCNENHSMHQEESLFDELDEAI